MASGDVWRWLKFAAGVKSHRGVLPAGLPPKAPKKGNALRPADCADCVSAAAPGLVEEKVLTTGFLQALRTGKVAAARARKCFHAVTRQAKSSAGCLVGRRSVFRLTGDLPQGVWWVVDSLSLLLSGTLASAGKGTLLHSLFCRGCLGVELLHPTNVSDDRIIWSPVRRGQASAGAMKHDGTS